MGNVVNRVFDSSGPEGKVRGTPQQIIDKYSQLARDASLSNDRVAMENFQQHAEHYTRMLSEAQREAEQRREQDAARREQQQQDAQSNRNRDRGGNNNASQQGGSEQPEAAVDPAEAPQPDVSSADVIDVSGDQPSGLVETPESAPVEPRPRRQRRPRKQQEEAKTAEAKSEPKADPAPESSSPEAAE